MSLTDDFLRELNKQDGTPANKLTKDFALGLQNKKKKKKEEEDIAPVKVYEREDDSSDQELAPLTLLLANPLGNQGTSAYDEFEQREQLTRLAEMAENAGKKKKENEGWFKSGLFADGWDALDLTGTILGTTGDVLTNIVKGAGNMVEGVTDLLLYGVSEGADLVGADSFADDVKNVAKKNTVNSALSGMEEMFNETSIFGNKMDSVSQGLGQIGGILLTGGIGGAAGLGTLGTTALTTGTMGLSSWGGGMSEAYQSGDDVSDEDAWAYGFTKGVVDAGSELVFGGLGKTVKAIGLSKGITSLDDMFAKKLSSKIANQAAKNFVQFGVKASAEGLEEVMAGLGTAFAKKWTYMSDEDINKLIADENLLDQFIVGTVTSSIAQSGIVPGMSDGSLKESIKTGKDFITGMTQNEQKVVDKVFEDEIKQREENGEKLTKKDKNKLYDEVVEQMEKGQISTDTIEEVLGGDSYKTYKDTIDSENALVEQEKALTDEYKELNKKVWQEMTGEEHDRREELKEQLTDIRAKIKENEQSSASKLLKAQLNKDVYELTKNDRLRESYFERVRANQKYEANLTQYTGRAKDVIQKVMDSGLADNTNATHEFWDMMAKMSSDLDTDITLATDEQILEMVKAEYEADGLEFDASKFDGQRIDGYVSKNGIVLNAKSKRALNFVVGHEITHKFEASPKHYKKLQELLFEYAKDEYESRFNERSGQYANKFKADEKYKAKVDKEITGDLVGDYIFNDKGFIDHLTKDRNVFMRVWDEVKYMAKIAKAGSEQAKLLEKAKREFERAYREAQKNNTADTSGVNFALENSRKSKYNKRSRYSETETLFLSWENGSAPAGEVKKFARFGKTRYYEKTENGSVELSRQQYIERNKVYAENIDRRAERETSEAYDYDENTQRGSFGDYIGDRNTNRNAAVFGQAIREELPDVTRGSESSTLRNDIRNTGIKQSEYNDEASEDPDASFVTFSNDYAAIRNFMKDGDVSEDSRVRYSLSEETNKAYLDAANRGDTDTAQKMVDESAREWSEGNEVYTTDPETGEVIFKFYRSADGGRTVWNGHGNNQANGVFLTSNEYIANAFDPDGKHITVYAKASNPFEIDAKGEIYTGIPVDESAPDWLQDAATFDVHYDDEVGDYVETMSIDIDRLFPLAFEQGYDAVIATNIKEGVGGGLATDVVLKDGGKQMKSADPVTYDDKGNVIPLSERFKKDNEDIRFSLSEAVEETKDLMALHNLHTNEVLKQLEMGGMPYPSVAITNPSKIAHEGFGDVSLVLKKDAIDPKKSKYNHIYSSDAYTPTFPHISYEANREVADKVIARVRAQFDKIPDYYQRSLRSLRDDTNLNVVLNNRGGFDGLVESYVDDHGMKQLYLAEKGEAVPMVINRTETELTDYQKALYQTVVDRFGEDEIKSLNDRGFFNTLGEARIAWTKEHLDVLKDIYAEDWSSDGTMTKAEAMEIANEQKLFYWYKEATSALEYLENGGLTVVEKEDLNATNAKVDEKVDGSDYKQWLNELFSGIEGQSGIRNSKDTFLPSGKRRNFAQLHDPVTIDNVIKVMRKKEQTGQGAVGGYFSGAAVQEYGSIAEAKRNANMLGVIDEAEYLDIKHRIDDTLYDISKRYSDGKDIIDAKNAIVEAVAKNESKAGIARYLQQYDYVFKYTDDIADDIIELRNYVRSLPRPYFEAKPRRAVGFDEVAVFVIPRNADVKLKQELLNRGYSIAEYDPDVEGDRQKVVNQFEQYKFSLSDVGKQRKDTGGYQYYSHIPNVSEDIAPIENNVQNGTNISTEDTNVPVENAVAPVMEEAEEIPATEETEMFPDDLAPMAEDDSDALDRLASLDDADAPPEKVEYDDKLPSDNNDPFYNRDMSEVGNRKVKSYMYENPEVKPFFQEAALGMLGDLYGSTKGEKWYNDEVYYESGGEKGWGGTTRHTTDDIAELLDQWHYTYAEIEKGLQAIIEDHGAENNAVSKRIEFMLNDRLLYGYKDVEGRPMSANQAYKNLLKEKDITEYTKGAFDNLVANGDDIAPMQDVVESTPVVDAPVAEQYEAIRPKREPSNEPKLIRVDSDNKGKQRKWVKTSTESEAVDGKVKPEELNQDLIHYQPIPNKKTLDNANNHLNKNGYENSVIYFEGRLSDKKINLDDIALGERLIQEAIKRGDTKTAMDLITDISILGTELGQKVQALSIIKRLTPEGQLRALKRVVERGKTKGDKAYDGVEVTQEMADQILNAYKEDGSYDQTYLNEMVEDVKQKIADQMKVTKGEKITAWRYLSMLGNPKTHIRNLVSNVAMKGTVAVKNAVARTIEGIAPIENRTKTWKAASDDVKAFAKRTTLEMKDEISGDSKYSESASIKDKRATFKNKILNGVYEFNSNMLSKEDWWFSKSAFNNALSEFLTANGIRTEQDIKKNPEIVAKAKQYALEQSQIATFRQYSWLANKINEIEQKNAFTNFAVGSILPFKKTPINIAKTGLNYSPLGFVKTLTYDIHQVKNGNMEASALVDHLAQNVTGSALTLVGFMLAQSGLLNGAGDDDKEGSYDYQLGKQAYSVNIGGKTYSLSWLSPVAMPLFVGANAYEQLVEGKEWNGDVVVETLAQTLDPLSEMSFLSSLDSVLSSYDSGIEKFAGIIETMGQNYITQFAPTLMSQVAQVTDDTKRSTKVSGDSSFKFMDETINKLKYKIPGLRQTLEPSTDIWGNEIKQTENILGRAFETFFAPYSAKENITSAVDEEIKDLFSQTGDSGVVPFIPYNYINYDGEKYNMSASEFTAYKKTYGQTAYNMLQDLFATNTYKNADSETRAEMVNMVYDYARDEAKKNFLFDNGVKYTNATANDVEYYKENDIKGAIESDMPVDEYKFSKKNPEKYTFLKSNNISYAQYESFDEDTKDAWSWAYKNPEKFEMSKAVSNDVAAYRSYASDLYDIKADKDEYGKSISGSRKEKVIDYLNNLDLDYGAKLILFKSEYEADDTYNYEIIEYLNSRSDISYKQMETILKELGFRVDAEGNIWWD